MKKYDCVIWILFFLCVSVFSFPIVQADLPLQGKVIYLDVGHGGVDPGSVVGSIYEKDINLAISKYLKSELEKYGAFVYLIREDDYDLGSPHAFFRKKSDFDNRIKKINQSNADLYLSIHLNVLSNQQYYGPQIFFNKKHVLNEKFATHLQSYLNEKIGTSREVKTIPTSTYMYQRLRIPGVLVECGFLSNPMERKKLITESYQQLFATYVAEAVRDFNFESIS